jgi:hypothetical protein
MNSPPGANVAIVAYRATDPEQFGGISRGDVAVNRTPLSLG